ncbi:DUF4012 domain-containing protein [Pseudarthrobacter sp. H3Y2-7]|uniref:DUF4012 domain-containing protein n=1 Tax=Pseudarthrobacter naphthalenicus TaxID=3031328 RepID=UPI0023B10BD8|nr:DUF4012 domain-containing protein [Pseudarthrobacter sp. H3Y2-7]MDE8668139.1 DUF4012 domain-containing protein [Pseudarthrobacter sp. H3Y2-7]
MTLGAALVLLAAAGGWLASKANQINTELRAAESLVPTFTAEMLSYDGSSARLTIDQIAVHTGSARTAANDPVWKLATGVPLLGNNFAAVRELTVAADEVANSSAKPLVNVVSSLDLEHLTPTNGKLDLEPLEAASPTIVSAATTVELSHSRLLTLDPGNLVAEVAQPLAETIDRLETLSTGLNTASQVSRILPSMMGSNGTRDYLVLVQNNAEIRASGGLPGALAVIRVNNGTIELVGQASGSEMGRFEPHLDVDEAQAAIYSTRVGTFISDVNLTPDFPTTAKLAKGMWERRYGGSIDGVVGIDPVVLAHILEASGPIDIAPSGNVQPPSSLPSVLTSKNVVKTLLSEVYLNLSSNELQDAYFMGASHKIFESLASGHASGPAVLKALTLSYEENRVHLWSDHQQDQSVLRTTELGGSTSGPSVGGASFGVYFNDGTGAKMDFYMRRTVQLVEVCTYSGYAEYKVRVNTANAAPADAARSLPTSVTGDGRYGTPPGSVQTNVVFYGPAMSYVDAATADGRKVEFGSHIDGNRPVGTVTTRLAPGESSTVEMSFVKVVQHSTPTLSVTPTVQDVNDVTLTTENAQCR